MFFQISLSGPIVELYEYEKPYYIGLKNFRRTRFASSSEDRTPTTAKREDNTRQCRNRITRLVNANINKDFIPKFFTLTFKDNLTNLTTAHQKFRQYRRDFQDQFGPIKYLAVPEFQKRGTLHFHILCWGIPQEIIKHERDTRTLQNLWALGFVDCRQTDGSAKLAGYLAKYMSKSLHDVRLAGKKAYSCSRNVLRPMSYNSDTIHTIPENIFLARDIAKVEFPTMWLGKGTYTLSTLDDIPAV